VLHTAETQAELAAADDAFQKKGQAFSKANWNPKQYDLEETSPSPSGTGER
jgi:hypothetical protein